MSCLFTYGFIKLPPNCAAGLSHTKQGCDHIIFSHSSPGRREPQSCLTARLGWELKRPSERASEISNPERERTGGWRGWLGRHMGQLQLLHSPLSPERQATLSLLSMTLDISFSQSRPLWPLVQAATSSCTHGVNLDETAN